MDWIPGISQVKALVQVTFGDAEGARQTQENFLKQCPVVSQVTAGVQAIMGDLEGARNTQKEFGRMLIGIADGVPVVGHIKGGIHYACGDKKGGDRAMKAASHTTAVIGGGMGGMMVGGPVGAVGFAIAAGTTMDGITTAAEYGISGDYKPEGILVPFSDPTNPGAWVDAVGGVAMDGLAGRGAGRAVKGLGGSGVIDIAAYDVYDINSPIYDHPSWDPNWRPNNFKGFGEHVPRSSRTSSKSRKSGEDL